MNLIILKITSKVNGLVERQRRGKRDERKTRSNMAGLTLTTSIITSKVSELNIPITTQRPRITISYPIRDRL